MGLFDKKYCDVCGERIRLLGGRKLEDGNLCKECAGKLSPWFNGRRHAAVSDIRAQLADREANRGKVAAFHTSRSFGEYGRLLLDDSADAFIVLRHGLRMEDNPDVLQRNQIQGGELKVTHSRLEEKQRNQENKLVSYNPPRVKHTYTFTISLRVDSPWFDQMQFRYHKEDVIIRSGMPIQLPGPLSAIPLYTPQEPEVDKDETYQRTLAQGQEILRALGLDSGDPLSSEAGSDDAVCAYCGERVVPEDGLCPCCGARLS